MKFAWIVTPLLGLALAGPVFAQMNSDNAGQPNDDTTTNGTTTTPGTNGAGHMAGMREMMAPMLAEMRANDIRLSDLVAKMNTADEKDRLNAVLAVINEMVSQQIAMHQRMAAMVQAPSKSPTPDSVEPPATGVGVPDSGTPPTPVEPQKEPPDEPEPGAEPVEG